MASPGWVAVAMDTVTPARRSQIMRKVRSKDSTAEWTVRRLVFGMGYRYRLHQATLPGKPDLVFSGRRKVIFVNGCFWHGHDACIRARLPKTNLDYWARKIERNVRRDKKTLDALCEAGWRSLVIWECELRELTAVSARIREFLDA